MIFKNVIRAVELYTRFEDVKLRELIKGFINESVLEFSRMYDWLKLKTSATITRDGSGSYDLAGLTEDFYREMSFHDENGAKLKKLDYENYIQLRDKTGWWAILGNRLYVSGDTGDYQLVYITLGEDYEMTGDDHEIPATVYYVDIIKKMAVIKVFDFVGETDHVSNENRLIEKKLVILKSSENRAKKNGKFMHINRNN